MNLLMRTVVGIRRWATPDLGFTLFVIGSVLVLEILGRNSPADTYDLLAILGLGMIGFLVMARHKRSPLVWVKSLHRPVDWLGTITRGWAFQMGLDMRGLPPVKRGTPPIISTVALILAISTVLFAGFAAWLPLAVRGGLMTVSYVVYLVGLLVLWTALVAAILLSAFVPLAVIHDTFVARHRGRSRRSRRGELLAIGAYFGILFALGVNLPFWVAPLSCATLTVCYLIGILPTRPFSVQFLWRPRGSIQVRSLTWAHWVTWEFILIGLAVQSLTLLAGGSLIVGDDLSLKEMPLTTLLGKTLAWLGPGLLGLLFSQMIQGRRRDPARNARPVVHVRDCTSGKQRAQLRNAFSQQGWKVRFDPATPNPLDVRIVLAAEALPFEQPPDVWPLVITPADLERPGLFVRLARRNEIQQRRRFLSSLESLLKLAKGKARSGLGYWLSPHYWFITGLMRDTRPGEEGDFDLAEDPILTAAIGPPYHRVFPRSVRHHLYQVMRATRVDLVFIEDGVSFKRLRRVLRVLFEVYDVHAGRRPAEEVDFRGLPGTRVVIHDFQFDEPYQSRTYPEPKYEFLGRARILHIFKDRGGQEEQLESPFDMDRSPAPLGVM